MSRSAFDPRDVRFSNVVAQQEVEHLRPRRRIHDARGESVRHEQPSQRALRAAAIAIGVEVRAERHSATGHELRREVFDRRATRGGNGEQIDGHGREEVVIECEMTLDKRRSGVPKDAAPQSNGVAAIRAHVMIGRTATDVRMLLAVGEVDDETDQQPDHQPQPGVARQAGHQPEAAQDAEDRHERNERRLEGTRDLGRAHAQDPHAGAHDHEGEQRPDAHELAEQADREEARDDGGDAAREDRRDVRRLELRVHLAEDRRKQSVARHGEEDARLAHEHHQHHRREAGERADLDRVAQPRERGARRLHRDEDRRGIVQLGVVHHARHDERHQDVQHGADGQRAENADRHVALRVLRFLRRGAHRIESDVGEEDHARAAQHAAPAELAELAGVRRE